MHYELQKYGISGKHNWNTRIWQTGILTCVVTYNVMDEKCNFKFPKLRIHHRLDRNGPLTRYVKMWIVHAREYRERFPRHQLQRKSLVSDPGMHHGTCVKHVPWCMSEYLTRVDGENVPGIPDGCATRYFTYLEWHRGWKTSQVSGKISVYQSKKRKKRISNSK